MPFTCLFDPRYAHVGKRLTLERYLAHDHVIVSYSGDQRGFIEDRLGLQRRVRLSVSNFHTLAAVVDGSPLLATVPEPIGRECVSRYPTLRVTALPFAIMSGEATTSTGGLAVSARLSQSGCTV